MARFTYALKRGPLAIAPKAWGLEFELIEPRAFTETEGLAVVDICGPLEQHPHPLCDNYASIRARVEAAFCSTARAVCLRIDSPGGDFAGSIELSKELRTMRAKYNKPLVAFTDSQALSAAYAIASAADQIVVTESGYVGSIGVWAALVDETAADRAKGLNVVIVAVGDRKVDKNPHVPITADAIDATRGQVEAMASMFFDLVSANRVLPRASVIDLQGSEFFGERAKSLGLADRVETSWYTFVDSMTRYPSGVEMTVKAKAESDEKKDDKPDYDAALAGMRKAAEEGDEAARAAFKAALKAHLKSMSEGEEEGESEDKGKGTAEGDDDKKEEAKASAQALSVAVALSKEVEALKSREKARAEADERAALMASRPDFDDTIKGLLGKMPIVSVREAVKNLPKQAARFEGAAAAASVTPTVGAKQGEFHLEPTSEEGQLLAKAFGGATKGNDFFIGCGDAKAAARYLASVEASRNGGGK